MKYMTLDQAQELQKFGEKIDVSVTLHVNADIEKCHVTFRDYEVYDYATGMQTLKRIQETELPAFGMI